MQIGMKSGILHMLFLKDLFLMMPGIMSLCVSLMYLLNIFVMRIIPYTAINEKILFFEKGAFFLYDPYYSKN